MNSNKKAIVSYKYVNAFIATLDKQLYAYKYLYRYDDVEKYINCIKATIDKIKQFNSNNVVFIDKNSKISPEKVKAVYDKLECLENEFEKVLEVFQKYLQMKKQ